MASSIYIDGQWCSAHGGATREIRSPADGSLVAVVSEAGVEDALAAISAARGSFDSGIFSSLSWSERSALLSKVADLLERDLEILAALESGDTGKRIIEAKYDVADVAATFRYFATLALEQGDRAVDSGQPHISSRITHEGIGVCSLIGPWNYPLLQIAWKVAPA